MKPISQEKRKIIVAAKERGEKAETIALWVGVAVSSVFNICRLNKKTNDITPKPFRGRQSILSTEQLEEIRKTVENENDITLEELIDKLGLPIKKSRLSVILIGMGFSFKKRRFIQKLSSGKMSFKNVQNGKTIKKS